MPPTRARHVTLAFMLALAVITTSTASALDCGAVHPHRTRRRPSSLDGRSRHLRGPTRCSRSPAAGWAIASVPAAVLMRIVIWWSVFTAATGQVWSLPSLIVCQALFGAGEASVSETSRACSRRGFRRSSANARRRCCGWPHDGAARSHRSPCARFSSTSRGTDVRHLRRHRSRLGRRVLPVASR